MKRSAAAACWPSSPTPLPRRRKSSMPFNCTICGEESTRICVWCTKDTCANHLCQKCERCSDCCECEVPLAEPLHDAPTVHSPPREPSPTEPMPPEPLPPEPLQDAPLLES